MRALIRLIIAGILLFPYISEAASTEKSVEEINKIFGIELFRDDNLFDDKRVKFQSGQSIEVLGVEAREAWCETIYDEDTNKDILQRVNIHYYQYPSGRLNYGSALSKEAALIKTNLNKAFGPGKEIKIGLFQQKVTAWTYGNNLIILYYAPSKHLYIRIYPRDKHFNSPKEYKQPDYKKNVLHHGDGDVVNATKLAASSAIDHIYGIVKYYGLAGENDLEQGLIDEICGASSTKYTEAMTNFAARAKDFGLTVTPIKDPRSFSDISKWVDRGILISCEVKFEYIVALKESERGELREKMSREEWGKNLQKLTLPRLKSKITVCAYITGYNAKTSEIQITRMPEGRYFPYWVKVKELPQIATTPIYVIYQK